MFHRCSTQLEAKRLYHELAQRLHPDRGGSNQLMTILIESFKHAMQKMPQEKYRKVTEDIFEGDQRLDIISNLFDGILSGQCYDWQLVTTISADLEKQGYLTPTQYNALVKIYEHFKMDSKKVYAE
jgi:hypothetical protein